ncbi:hypothetical protein psyc5s11_19580 [Clostridium gelidum]|uniref:Uncharacterized protein n=1 Tax=Clostridium gelidum TaxID=704125 RepID=A0ABM7T3V9_9CLOT|nr:hypothetical protein psyc5s11_19580 [Clostridium gelidum]
MLECTLIIELKPRYNRLMKNPLSYTYIKIELGEKYPSIEISITNSQNEHTFILVHIQIRMLQKKLFKS